jgi:hypothetical protein
MDHTLRTNGSEHHVTGRSKSTFFHIMASKIMFHNTDNLFIKFSFQPNSCVHVKQGNLLPQSWSVHFGDTVLVAELGLTLMSSLR